MTKIVERFPSKIKSVTRQFNLCIETERPEEIELGTRFLAELNAMRDVRTSWLAEAFKARCEPEPVA